jgi:hypothetical protein
LSDQSKGDLIDNCAINFKGFALVAIDQIKKEIEMDRALEIIKQRS